MKHLFTTGPVSKWDILRPDFVCLPQADVSEFLGLKDYMGVMFLITAAERVEVASDERVKVADELFDTVKVLVYQPRQDGWEGGRRRAVIYLHGGGWCLGSSGETPAGPD